jgi:two-component system, NtrC family, response regulator HydG
MRSQILFVSGDRSDARQLTGMLHELPLALDHATSIRQARSKLEKKCFNVVLTEAALPDGDWLDVLRLSRNTPTEPQVIVTDAQADARFWAEALNLGAYDMLAQPFFEPEVRRILSNVCSRPGLVRAAV